MKNSKLISFFASVLMSLTVGMGSASAETNDLILEDNSSTSLTTSVTNEEKKPSNSTYLVGLKATKFDYEEPGVMTDRGMLTGVAGSYFHRLNEFSILRLDGEYLKGETSYEGGISNGYSYQSHTSNQNYRVTNLSAVWVVASDLTYSFITAPFVGLGYRNTFDAKDDRYDYRRDITYIYLILGPQFEVITTAKQTLLVNVELDTLLGGQVKTYLSDVSSRYRDMEMPFRGGSAFKIGLEYYYTIKGTNRVMADLSYKKWSIAESEPVQSDRNTYFIEPANSTALTSLTLGYVF